MSKVNIAVTGYYATGSSAMIDLLAEYSNTQVVPYGRKNYEHVPFYIANGLFNLAAILLNGNSPLVSDAAINQFLDSMRKCNDYDFGWFGGYAEMFGDSFTKITDDFINSIASEFPGRNLNHNVKTELSTKSAIIQVLSAIKHLKPIKKWQKKVVFDDKKSYFAIPTEEEFYEAAQKFTSAYLNLFEVKQDCEYRIFDHLVLPQQIEKYKACFGEDVKFIVMERDPRDVYVSNKYMWFKNSKPYFPREPHAYSDIWRRIVQSPQNSDNVLVVNFENLIYKYDEEVARIEKFLGLAPSAHIYPQKFFNPNVSIDNTQLFKAVEEWGEDMPVIEDELANFLYQYPYERIPKTEDIFSYKYLKTDSSKK